MAWTELCKGLYSNRKTFHVAILKMEVTLSQPIYTLLVRGYNSIYYVNLIRFYIGPETETELLSADLHKWDIPQDTLRPTEKMFELCDNILTSLQYP